MLGWKPKQSARRQLCFTGLRSTNSRPARQRRKTHISPCGKISPRRISIVRYSNCKDSVDVEFLGHRASLNLVDGGGGSSLGWGSGNDLPPPYPYPGTKPDRSQQGWHPRILQRSKKSVSQIYSTEWSSGQMNQLMRRITENNQIAQ